MHKAQTSNPPGPKGVDIVDSNRKLFLIGILVIILATMMVRFTHLDADPVPWFTEELGYRIDEGYKTLSPRNLSVFGKTHWHPEDEYPGWMRSSAVTQWPYYWSFVAFGTRISSARIVSILYFGILITIAATFLWIRTSPKAAALGVLLLSLDPGLFLFSRSALFENSLALFTYLPLFLAIGLAALLPKRFRFLTAAILLVSSIPAFLYLKKSIVIYIAPIFLGMVLHSVKGWMSPAARLKALLGFALLSLAFAVLILIREPWILDALNISAILRRPQSIFLNPIHTLSPLSLVLGYIIIFELLLKHPSALFDDPYRLSLSLILILSPIGFSLFQYNYPRYYLPIIPAALLLVVERLSIDLPRQPSGVTWRSLPGLLAGFVFAAWAMTLLATINYYILGNIPVDIGADPGLSDPMLLKIFPAFLVLLAATAYYAAKYFPNALNKTTYHAVAGLHVLAGVFIIFSALYQPSYQSQQITHRIIEIAGEDATIGGDWAPLFAVNTKLRVLYMRPDFNSADRIEILRPGYFLFCDTPYDRKNLDNLKNQKNIQLEDPIYLGKYADHAISIYPIRYLHQ